MRRSKDKSEHLGKINKKGKDNSDSISVDINDNSQHEYFK